MTATRSGLSADWGSAGAMSGPPQLKGLKKCTIVRQHD
jgi:hypothetical protein